jgi:hypothetical protein
MSTRAPNTLRRALPPLLLAAAGVWLLVGCVYIPGFERVTMGKDVSGKVGDDRSSRPLRLGRATREDVVRVLGEPGFVSSTGRAVAYGWGVTDGYLFNGLCPSMSETFRSSRSLVLRFDERGVLQEYQLLKGPTPRGTTVGLKLLLIILPEDLRRDWIEQEKRRAAEQDRRAGGAAATRPASQPVGRSGERSQPVAN